MSCRLELAQVAVLALALVLVELPVLMLVWARLAPWTTPRAAPCCRTSSLTLCTPSEAERCLTAHQALTLAVTAAPEVSCWA